MRLGIAHAPPDSTSDTWTPEIVIASRYAEIRMELHLEPALEARLARLAAERGSNVETLAREAIERLVDYDEWFVREVEKGLASAERGELLTHEEVIARMEKLISQEQSRL